jgi:hypothetical protein
MLLRNHMIWLLAHPSLRVSSTGDIQETQKEIQLANHTVANTKFVKHVCLLSSNFILVYVQVEFSQRISHTGWSDCYDEARYFCSIGIL